MTSRVEGTTSSFRPRQSSYLRISPSTVLQFIMYLEPAHVDWMTDERLDRVLYALKERIPAKLEKERSQGKKKGPAAKEKTHVDVYRGSDYQMAFFFRRTSKKHVVLLKDKHLMYHKPTSQSESEKCQREQQSQTQDVSMDLTNLRDPTATPPENHSTVKAEPFDVELEHTSRNVGPEACIAEDESKPELRVRCEDTCRLRD
ncbi:hypothetical protein OIO90_001408 [Microbotryomycetes sp. JL221]|nr:hypothetical protein OIO90_001408 [Microbotryomycetes sp. JL221]